MTLLMKKLIPPPAWVALLLLLLCSSEAREYLVGGQQNSWKIPSSPDQFNKWASNSRFSIGDYLVLEYDPKSDSVLEVTENDYKNCNKSKPLRSFNDGKTKIELSRSGPFYFISGADGHCEKGQKVEIKVLSAKHGAPHRAISPSPAPSPFHAPAPAPAPAKSAAAAAAVGGAVAVIASALVGFPLLFWFKEF